MELKGHLPFTLFGALLGIAFMLILRNVGQVDSHVMFAFFHPAHVVLSAMVTASMFKLHAFKKRLVLMLVVGYLGSIGIATVSDVVIPHFGAELLGLHIPTHAELYEHEEPSDHGDIKEQHVEHRIYLGFIEEWYIVNPAALLGILIAWFLPRTKFPHAGHVLISTWASSSYLLMNIESAMTIAIGLGIFAILFIATWLPCCISDIIFPLLFVKSDVKLTGSCPFHDRHSHGHVHQQRENSQ